MEAEHRATVEEVREFLQDMKQNVNRLCRSCGFGRIHKDTQKCSDAQIRKSFPSENGNVDNAIKVKVEFPTELCSSAKLASSTVAGNGFSVLLEDMRNTIEAWCSRLNVLVEGDLAQYDLIQILQPHGSDRGKSNERQSDEDHQTSTTSHEEKVPAIPQQLPELNFESTKSNGTAGLGELECRSNNPQNGLILQPSGVDSDRGKSNERQSDEDHQTSTTSHEEKVPAIPQQLRELNFESTKSNGIAGSGELECRNNNPQKDSDQVDMGVAFGCKCHLTNSSDDSHHSEDDPVANAAGDNPREPKKESSTSNGSKDGTTRRIEPKVEVVESPDWLPKGWITELKTRSSGGSAGCKDKYYYDPVSNRRCRSQKEVFSLISTGKLGRYKKRIKSQPQMKQTETSTTQQQNDNVVESAGKQETSAMGPTGLLQCNTPESAPPLAFSHPGGMWMANNNNNNNMFFPCRPGQTSERVFYESMANIPHPMLEHFQIQDCNPSKVDGGRIPTYSRPMLFVASETSVRASAGKANLWKATENETFYGGDLAGRQAKRSKKQAKRDTGSLP